MDKELIGMLSGGIVFASALPYAIQTFRRKVKPNITTWSLWALIGLALLLTYDSSGAGANVWPAVLGFVNPCIIAGLAIWRRSDREPLTRLEWGCVVFGVASLSLWLVVRDSEKWAQYALYLAIAADICAAIPTIKFVWKSPEEDRPAMWVLFAIGYGLGAFAISEHTFANWILPTYMFLGAFFVALPLILHRIKMRTPITQWI